MATKSDFDTALATIVNDYDANMTLKPKQIEIFRHLWDQKQAVIAALPTGYGKSLIFHLCGRVLRAKKMSRMSRPVIAESSETEDSPHGITLCITPLNIIQRDQVASLRAHNITACSLDVRGHFFLEEKECVSSATVADIAAGRYEVVIAHPEALLCTDEGRRLLNDPVFCRRVTALVIDECHTVDLWGAHFRTAFGQLDSLQSFFQCPTIALSATLTKEIWNTLPTLLGMKNVVRVSENPDKPNIFFERKRKPSNMDIVACSESVFMPELRNLRDTEEGHSFPVTLCYLPLSWMADAMVESVDMFGRQPIRDLKCTNFFSSQHHSIISHVTEELKKESPTLRLVFCSPAIGMGFDSPSVTRIVHGKPPRRAIDFLQQVGRAGRKGQQATSVLHFNANDYALVDATMKEYCKTDKCLRLCLLKAFDFEQPVVGLPGCKCCSNCALACQCAVCKP